ncbi:succinylglutamate desuccinylase/aspartoacylase family protein [Roseivirga sp.]|uniref:succinylglutamate desuccinylase/aspartoacylase family protein n=1 Tax=Roseivirga sp. TaxID=1964215 RepID=UPI002B26C798|nr:succinylglutamate desuccinylase/aspartoacylase family protein [Roseivirga sp.]
MIDVHSKALNQTISINRLIGRVDGKKSGPCLIFFGGIHGNEPAGVFALHQVFQEIKNKQEQFSGSCIALSGNMWALERSVRYHKADLNRLWTSERIASLDKANYTPKNEDEKQQLEIYNLLQDIIKNEHGPFYFFDLHTTSSNTIPFITVNDSLLNRKFTSQYPVPLILGIEEYLDGPVLSYVNELGYVSFGFEGGQHDTLSSIESHKTFIYLSLVFTGALNKNELTEYDSSLKAWQSFTQSHSVFYEIYSRTEVKKNEQFIMNPGFSNFQPIARNQSLATLNGKALYAKEKSIIFMPLYQSQGSDGYFLIRKIPHFYLWLSMVLRKLMVDKFFVLLPGVKWSSDSKETMLVDLKIARLIPKQILHLFGYRSKRLNKNELVIKNREYRSKNEDYQQEKWWRIK